MPRFVITGIKEIDKRLAQLEPRLAKKVIRQAMRTALKPVADAVRANAPVLTGRTRRAVKIRAGKSRRGKITVEVRIGEGDYKGDEFYASFQEFGWKAGKRGSENRRQIPGKHFMERAFNRTKDAARDQAIKLILEGAEREIRALGSGG